jgi:hypothetical protein
MHACLRRGTGPQSYTYWIVLAAGIRTIRWCPGEERMKRRQEGAGGLSSSIRVLRSGAG